MNPMTHRENFNTNLLVTDLSRKPKVSKLHQDLNTIYMFYVKDI